uniref:TNF receptor-associated factor 1 n=1 Tax=Ascaris suum TaxID=6253 RepID=F1L9S2_ASCSU
MVITTKQKVSATIIEVEMVQEIGPPRQQLFMKTLSASSIRPEPITRSLTPVGNPEYGSADVHPADHRPPSACSDKSAILVQPKGKTSKTNDIGEEEDALGITECPFAEFGCDVKLPLNDIKKHIKEGSMPHLLQMCDSVSHMAVHSGVLTSACVDASHKAEDVIGRVHEIETLFSSQYLWRLSNYSNIYANARRGQPAVVYSTVFSSHRHGYKLALAFAPYGDSDAIGESNSIFLTIIRGEYDAILPWPFICPITFTMINQKNGENVSRILTPRVTDANMIFLNRPNSERNPAFGLKSFVELRMMEERDVFVRNDTCFIRVHIDLTPIQKYI